MTLYFSAVRPSGLSGPRCWTGCSGPPSHQQHCAKPLGGTQVFWDRWVLSPSGWFAVGHLRNDTRPRNHLSWLVRELEELQVKDKWNTEEEKFWLVGDFEEPHNFQSRVLCGSVSLCESQNLFGCWSGLASRLGYRSAVLGKVGCSAAASLPPLPPDFRGEINQRSVGRESRSRSVFWNLGHFASRDIHLGLRPPAWQSEPVTGQSEKHVTFCRGVSLSKWPAGRRHCLHRSTTPKDPPMRSSKVPPVLSSGTEPNWSKQPIKASSCWCRDLCQSLLEIIVHQYLIT